MLPDCCGGFKNICNGNFSSNEIICRSLIYKLNKSRASLVELDFGHSPAQSTSSPALQLFLRFRGETYGSEAALFDGSWVIGALVLLLASSGVEL